MRVIVVFLVFSYAAEIQAQEMSISSIHPVTKVKRGKSYQFSWNGGQPSDNISIRLENNKAGEIVLGDMLNTGSSSLKIPSKVKPGKYSIRVNNLTSGESSTPYEVKVRRRVPLAVTISPLVVMTFVIWIYNGPQAEMIDNPQPPPDSN